MDQNIEEKVTLAIEDIKKMFDQEMAKLEKKRLEVMQATRNKSMIEQQQIELNKIKADLERRERELALGVEENRKRTTILELQEQKLAKDKESFRTTVRSLNLE